MREAPPPDVMPASVRVSGPAIDATAPPPGARPALPPMDPYERVRPFNAVCIDAFEQIALGGRPVRDTLDAQAEVPRAVMREAAAPRWAPDAPSEGACPVDRGRRRPTPPAWA